MPGPVVNGVRQATLSSSSSVTGGSSDEPQLPLMAEGTIRLLLLSSGELLMARFRTTTDGDGQPAYQLIRPRRVLGCDSEAEGFTLTPFLNCLTPQSNLVLFKHAVASVLEPDGLLLDVRYKAHVAVLLGGRAVVEARLWLHVLLPHGPMG